MLDKILQHVGEHLKKFNYILSESEKDELMTLYEMNHDTYDETSLSLHIETFMSRIANRDRTDWALERRQSVSAKKVHLKDFELPSFVKTKEEFEFLYSMLGSEIPFSFLSPSQKNKLVSSMYPMIVDADVVLIHQGETGSEMYIIEEGEFDVLIDGVFVNKLYSSTKFGELALLHEIPRTATVKATKKSKIWAAEQTSFSCIRIRDSIYKKGLVKEALESNKDLTQFQNNPAAINQAVSIASFKIFLSRSEVKLLPEEILVVFKDARIHIDSLIRVHKKDIIRSNFVAQTDLECAIINIKNIRR